MTAAEEMALYLDVPLDVEIELDRFTATVRDVLELRPGTVIRLNRLAGDNLDIRIGGEVVASGEVVANGACAAVRLTDIRQD